MDKEIRENIERLRKAIDGNQEQVAAYAALDLLNIFMQDFRRMSYSLEHIAHALGQRK